MLLDQEILYLSFIVFTRTLFKILDDLINCPLCFFPILNLLRSSVHFLLIFSQKFGSTVQIDESSSKTGDRIFIRDFYFFIFFRGLFLIGVFQCSENRIELHVSVSFVLLSKKPKQLCCWGSSVSYFLITPIYAIQLE